MTKHRIHRKTRNTRKRRRSQRGGGWFDAINPFASSEQNTSYSTGVGEPGLISNLTNSVSSTTSNLVSGAESALSSGVEKAKGTVSNSGSWFSSMNPFSSGEGAQPSMYNSTQVAGKRTKRMKGGKGGLGLTYYATDVSNDGLKMAEPTYWIKGGSKKRHKTRRHKTHRKRY